MQVVKSSCDFKPKQMCTHQMGNAFSMPHLVDFHQCVFFWHQSKVITIWENLVLPPKPDDSGLTGMYVGRVWQGECVALHDAKWSWTTVCRTRKELGIYKLSWAFCTQAIVFRCVSNTDIQAFLACPAMNKMHAHARKTV